MRKIFHGNCKSLVIPVGIFSLLAVSILIIPAFRWKNFILFFIALFLTRRHLIYSASILPILLGHLHPGLGLYTEFFCYVGFYWVLLYATSHYRTAVIFGFIVGAALGFCSTPFLMTMKYSWVIMSLLAIYNGLIWAVATVAVFAILLGIKRKKSMAIKALCLPFAASVIPLAEYFRACNVWIPLGYNCTFHFVAENLYLAQLAEFVDFLGLAILLCLTNLVLVFIFHDFTRNTKRALAQLFGVIVTLGILHYLGYRQLQRVVDFPVDEIRVVVVQPLAAPENSVTTAYAVTAEYKLAIIEKWLQEAEKEGIGCIFLPENSFVESERNYFNMLQIQSLLSLLQKYPGIDCIIGGISTDLDENRYRCSAGIITHQGVIATTDKYIPALIGEKRVNFITPANAMQFVCSNPDPLLQIPGGVKIGVLICHEHTFPNIWNIRKIDDFAQIDAQVCLSNMIWTGYSQLERLQSRRSRVLLAIQHRKPFLFVANGGSELIAPCGRVKDSIAPETTGAIFHLPVRQR